MFVMVPLAHNDILIVFLCCALRASTGLPKHEDPGSLLFFRTLAVLGQGGGEAILSSSPHRGPRESKGYVATSMFSPRKGVETVGVMWLFLPILGTSRRQGFVQPLSLVPHTHTHTHTYRETARVM